MTEIISLDINRKGFPIKIGNIEFFFSTTLEDLTRFFDLQDEVEKKLSPLEMKLNDMKDSTETSDKANRFIEISKEITKIQYDGLLGEGSFNTIYKEYKDIEQLSGIFEELALNVAKTIEKESIARKIL